MAGASLFTLIDKIATMLDDVAVLSKVAAKKTAGVLGDDLALNAQQVSGVSAERELPVVWAVAKGSAKNKLILVPAALLIGAFLPVLITPLLMIGGAYLCFEGVEKIAHSLFPSLDHDAEALTSGEPAPDESTENKVTEEQEKIAGAIRTDFILSAEIIVIALGTVQDASLLNQIMVVCIIAAVMTIGVYGLVAGIVKLDDAGLYLLQHEKQGLRGKFRRMVGLGLLSFAPKLMKSLSVVGTLAMFLVGGSILVHGLPESVHHVIEAIIGYSASIPMVGIVLADITPLLLDAVIGIVTGAIVLLVVELSRELVKRFKSNN
jgi:predicted DNA repair protein MutK